MKYFSPLDPTWNTTTGVIHHENGILDQIKFCKLNHCQVQIGFETSAEDPDCKTCVCDYYYYFFLRWRRVLFFFFFFFFFFFQPCPA